MMNKEARKEIDNVGADLRDNELWTEESCTRLPSLSSFPETSFHHISFFSSSYIRFFVPCSVHLFHTLSADINRKLLPSLLLFSQMSTIRDISRGRKQNFGAIHRVVMRLAPGVCTEQLYSKSLRQIYHYTSPLNEPYHKQWQVHIIVTVYRISCKQATSRKC
jgi:hypothetical protein